MLENITSVKILRETIDSEKLFDKLKLLFKDGLETSNKKSLVNIMFNLNFNLGKPHNLSLEFLKLLFKLYDKEE